ncbi:hypothetical protein GCM10011352_30330 [Marinobacterium zhoushanense]|uniref:Prepilin-type N-terminal cleavage/methylation domain-containing protein n=1 Tax=Marinobacterium zhoushanense TaxID=1679163 RepID=A0ABQ1KM54_9GAMM|nr:prepilin-type N-terminal cleavage/methylation domain-containing protein [Marinobacterium zhoushanense]GGC02063.1 hypothetical protein GCM10011352_30330 [Marinobacterium zhoushanense]
MKKRRSQGFTLIELLIALVLTGLVMMLLFSSLRIGSRSWDAVDRQQQLSEQYQLQMLLRRLVTQARNDRVSDANGVIQVAFRGERHQLVFIAPRELSGSGDNLLWYRLYLAEATTERPQALMLETKTYSNTGLVDWDLLFDPSPQFDEQGEEISPPKQYELRIVGEGSLEFRYLSYDESQFEQETELWVEEPRLPNLVTIKLENDALAQEARGLGDGVRIEPLSAAWNELSVALQEYTYGVRTD